MRADKRGIARSREGTRELSGNALRKLAAWHLDHRFGCADRHGDAMFRTRKPENTAAIEQPERLAVDDDGQHLAVEDRAVVPQVDADDGRGLELRDGHELGQLIRGDRQDDNVRGRGIELPYGHAEAQLSAVLTL